MIRAVPILVVLSACGGDCTSVETHTDIFQTLREEDPQLNPWIALPQEDLHALSRAAFLVEMAQRDDGDMVIDVRFDPYWATVLASLESFPSVAPPEVLKGRSVIVFAFENQLESMDQASSYSAVELTFRHGSCKELRDDA